MTPVILSSSITDVYQFSKAFCEFEVSINLVPYAIFKKLGLGSP